MLGFLLSIGDALQQTKLDSFLEALFSTFVGFMVSLVTNMIVMPIMGIPVSFSQNIVLTIIFTFVSVARSYMVRRFANKYLTQFREKVVEFLKKEVA